MRTHKLEEYDIGQILIAVSDCLFGAAAELKAVKPEIAKELEKMGRKVGSIFNRDHASKSHVFGLRDERD